MMGDLIERLHNCINGLCELDIDIARGMMQESKDALEKMQAENKAHDKAIKRIAADSAELLRAFRDENKRLQAVVDAAKEMRDDYEAYSYNTVTKKYDVPQHNVRILKAFNVAYNGALAKPDSQEQE